MHTISMKNVTTDEIISLDDIVKIEIHSINENFLTTYPPENLTRFWDESILSNTSFIRAINSDGSYRDFPISQWVCTFSK